MTRLATLALLALALAAQPTTTHNNPDATTTVYVARYGQWMEIQTEYIHLIPCLNTGACVLYEDRSIGPRR